MKTKGRRRSHFPRQTTPPGAWSSFCRTFGGFRCTSREGPQGDSPGLDPGSSVRGILEKGILAGAVLGGAGLIPGITVYGADMTGGMDRAMELTLASEETSVVSIDVEEKEELRSEQDKASLEEIATAEKDLLIEDGETPPEIVAASLSMSASDSTLASESDSMAQSVVVSASQMISASVSTSTLASESTSTSTSALQQQKAQAKTQEVSASDALMEETVYEEYYEEDFWEEPSRLLDDLFGELIETNEEDKDEKEDEQQELASLKASEASSLAASQKQSMFTSIAVAASELQEEGLESAARLESQYGLRDFAALANAMANENDAVRKSLDATIQQSEGDSEQMASILDIRSEKGDAFTSESMRVSERMAAMEEEAQAFSIYMRVSGRGEVSPSEFM